MLKKEYVLSLHPLSLKHTLKFVYQSEILQTIRFKLKPTFEQQCIALYFILKRSFL